MKMKKKILSAALALSMAFCGGSALAADPAPQSDACDCSINIYGASAQFKYWTAAAPNYLQTRGCAAGDTYFAEAKDFGDRDNGIAICAGGTPVGAGNQSGNGIGGQTVCIRYSTNASFEGVYAASCENPLIKDQTANDGFPNCTDPCTRLLADERTVSIPTAGVKGTINQLDCRDVTIGASDVQAATFNQESHGALKGPCGGDWEDRDIRNVDDYLCTGDDVTGVHDVYSPVVVPFTFFRNTEPGVEVPFYNMNEPMAAYLFSGAISDWSQFDHNLNGDNTEDVMQSPPVRTYPAGDQFPVTLCMRHAGSGTHATLDAAILHHWGRTLVKDQVLSTDPLYSFNLSPQIYFNKGSSDLMRCVCGGCPPFDSVGAVGYADADKILSSSFVDAPCERMLWTGFGCTTDNCTGGPLDTEDIFKDAITDGRYTFWSNQRMHVCDPDVVDCGTGVSVADLMAYAEDPSNLPSNKATWWAAGSEMQWQKNNDRERPVRTD